MISSRTRPSVVSSTGPADFDFQHAGKVLGSGKNFVARLFVRRQRFAGDRRLIKRSLAGDDDTVRRHVVTGTDADESPTLQFAGGDFLLVAVFRQDAALWSA